MEILHAPISWKRSGSTKQAEFLTNQSRTSSLLYKAGVHLLLIMFGNHCHIKKKQYNMNMENYYCFFQENQFKINFVK